METEYLLPVLLCCTWWSPWRLQWVQGVYPACGLWELHKTLVDLWQWGTDGSMLAGHIPTFFNGLLVLVTDQFVGIAVGGVLHTRSIFS